MTDKFNKGKVKVGTQIIHFSKNYNIIYVVADPNNSSAQIIDSLKNYNNIY